jgi:hypothetical protein
MGEYPVRHHVSGCEHGDLVLELVEVEEERRKERCRKFKEKRVKDG